jgi:2-C-methyl-D-erythritol 2,4-cyclodiphosphate synthase
VKEHRCGIGFDAHAFTDGRKLMLGGVEIDYHRGLEGHSDADVLIHAVIDALLGAAGLGDIGRHYPDTDRKYRHISSLLLLESAMEKLREAGWEVANIDATLIAQKPRLSGYIGVMQGTMARSIEIGIDRINIKATTTEGLGFTGREEGIAAMAVASICKQNR